MRILDLFRPASKKRRSAAHVAKERLQIIVSHEHTNPGEDFIQNLEKELLEVISKYIKIDRDQIRVQLERHGDQSVLELNVTLSEDAKPNNDVLSKVTAKSKSDKNDKDKNKKAQPKAENA